jgi:hypothetical protein
MTIGRRDPTLIAIGTGGKHNLGADGTLMKMPPPRSSIDRRFKRRNTRGPVP